MTAGRGGSGALAGSRGRKVARVARKVERLARWRAGGEVLGCERARDRGDQFGYGGVYMHGV